MLWWYWVVLGIGLVLAELVVPAFFIVWFGVGALLVGLSVLAVPEISLVAQIAVWIASSLAFIGVWFRVFRPGSHKTLVGTSEGEVIGEFGLAVTQLAPFQRGKVRFQRPILGSEEWACLSDETIAPGERVRVVSVEGSFLKVAKGSRGA